MGCFRGSYRAGWFARTRKVRCTRARPIRPGVRASSTSTIPTGTRFASRRAAGEGWTARLWAESNIWGAVERRESGVGGAVDLLDNQYIDRASSRFEFESQLLLKRSKDVWE